MNKKCTKNEQIRANSQTSRKNGQGACAFIYASETYAEIKKPSPRRKRLPPCPSDIPPTGAPRGRVRLYLCICNVCGNKKSLPLGGKVSTNGRRMRGQPLLLMSDSVGLYVYRELRKSLTLFVKMIFGISKPLIRLGLRRATFPPRGRLFPTAYVT